MVLFACVQLDNNGWLTLHWRLKICKILHWILRTFVTSPWSQLTYYQLDSSLELDLSFECCFETEGGHPCLSLSLPSATVPSLTLLASTPKKNDSALPSYGMQPSSPLL